MNNLPFGMRKGISAPQSLYGWGKRVEVKVLIRPLTDFSCRGGGLRPELAKWRQRDGGRLKIGLSN